jgi:hypothetical protein
MALVKGTGPVRELVWLNLDFPAIFAGFLMSNQFKQIQKPHLTNIKLKSAPFLYIATSMWDSF